MTREEQVTLVEPNPSGGGQETAARPAGSQAEELRAEVARLCAALAAAEARIGYLEELSDQDPLVPLLNRRAFLREAARYAALAERYDFLACLLYIDLDGLKAVNDAHGHAAGDAALRHVAELLLRNTRASDLVGRLGGDEFAVLLVQTDQATALRKGAQLTAQLGRRPLAWSGGSIALAMTCGTAPLRPGGTLLQALDAADSAMYAQKRRQATR